MLLENIGLLEHDYLGYIGSPEGLFDAISNENGTGGTGFIEYSEFGMLLASTNKKYSVDLIEILNNLYDCPRRRSRRLKGQSYTANDIFICILAATQLNSLTKSRTFKT